MTDATPYPENFYKSRETRSRASADIVMSILAGLIPGIDSVVDYGCGVGTWLDAARRQLGVDDIHGYEGSWVDSALMVVEAHQIDACDLTTLVEHGPPRRASLAMCLEVAEHLPAASADGLVDLLTGTASTVLFSAAIPGQGGKGHINEQWPDYWMSRFAERGYAALAPFRGRLWNDDTVRPWFAQNLFLFVHRSDMTHLLSRPEPEIDAMQAVVHPHVFRAALARQQAQIERLTSLAGAWRNFRRALLGRPYRVRPRRARDPRDERDARFRS